jgi:hypothetical protein
MAVTPPLRQRSRLGIGIDVATGVLDAALVVSLVVAFATGEFVPPGFWSYAFLMLMACLGVVGVVVPGAILAIRPEALGERWLSEWWLHRLGGTRHHLRLLGVAAMWGGCMASALAVYFVVQLATYGTSRDLLGGFPVAWVLMFLVIAGPVLAVRVWTTRGSRNRV